MRKSVFAVAVLALVAAGCSDSPETESSQNSNAAITTTTVANHDVDSIKVQAMRLQDTDLGSEWKFNGDRSKITQEDLVGQRSLATCLGRPNPQDTLSAASVSVFDNLEKTIGSSVNATKTVENAKADMAAGRGPKMGECLSAEWDKYFAREYAVAGPVTSQTKAEPLPGYVTRDDEVAIRTTSTVAAGGLNFTATTDYLAFTADRFELSLQITYLSGLPPLDFEQQLMTKLRDRISVEAAKS